MLTSLVILQPLNLCNLNCDYCYLAGRRNKDRMSLTTLHLVFQKLFACPQMLLSPLTMVWHAGEPLLAGRAFFEAAADALDRYRPPQLEVRHQIQTNGTVIDDKWCDLFRRRGFNATISIDGPRWIHDRHRLNWSGRGSFDLVMRGVDAMKRNGLPLKGIAVVTEDSLDHPAEIFAFFKDAGFNYMSFNVEEIDGANKTSSLGSVLRPQELARAEERYEGFLRRIFELWFESDRRMKIREVEYALRSLHFRAQYPGSFAPSSETMGMALLAIDRNGNLSTFSPELSPSFASGCTDYVVANLSEIDDLRDVLSSPKLSSLAEQIHRGTRKCAETCDVFDMCGGGSPSNKLFELGTFDATETSYCRLHRKLLFRVMENQLQARAQRAAVG